MQPSRPSPEVLVVIVNFRSTDVLLECLSALEVECRTDRTIQVSICENGSGDDSVDRIRGWIAAHDAGRWCYLRALDHNRGFTGGNNAIIQDALGSSTPPAFVLLLNPDTVPGPGMVQGLRSALQRHPRWGFVGPVMTHADGSQHPSCFRDIRPVNELLRAAGTGAIDRLFRRWIVSRPIPHREEPHEWITFACAMTRREVLEGVGLLDEGYFAYFDDADLCWRARRAGWVIGHCPSVHCVHLKGTSSGVHRLKVERKRPPAFQPRGRARYLAKRHGLAGLWSANVLWHLGRLVSLAREVLEWRTSHLPPGSWRDVWTNATRPWHAPHLPFPPLAEPDGSDRDEATRTTVGVR